MAKFASHNIKQDDSLQRLAYTLLGDRRRWTELADLNKLDYPYLVYDTLPSEHLPKKVLTINDDLLYPVPKGQAAPLQLSQKETEREAYGVDLLLTDGILTLISDPSAPAPLEGGASLALVEGIKNLKQAIQHRLNTPIGDLLAHPTYGHVVWQYVGEQAGTNEITLVNQSLQRCLAEDRRLLKVIANSLHKGTEGVLKTELIITPQPPSRLLRLDAEITPLTTA